LDSRKKVLLAATAADEKKAEDIVILDLRDVTEIADFFMICHGLSDIQIRAIVDWISRRLRQEKVRPIHIEGYEDARWVLMDYGDVVIHVFDEMTREYYLLERLWDHAKRIEWTPVGKGEITGE